MLILTFPARAGNTYMLENSFQVQEYVSMQIQNWQNATAQIQEPFIRGKVNDLILTPWRELFERFNALGEPSAGIIMRLPVKAVELHSDSGQKALASINNGNFDSAIHSLGEAYGDLNGPLLTVIEDSIYRVMQEAIPALLSATLDGWSERVKGAQQATDEINKIWTLARSTESSVNNSISQLNNRLNETTEQIKDAELKRESEWQAVVEAHRQKLELDATSVFWTSRAAAHRARALTLARAAFGAGAGSLILTMLAAYSLFHTASWLMGVEGAVNPLHRLIFATAGIALVLTLCLWTTRLVVRLYMTERHLAIDADSRAALGTTYLSLTSEGAATPEDRAIVLAALFRPVQDGIVQDDALPLISPAALMTGLLTQDKK